MKVLILAGGFATRLWPLTESRAKPMLLVDGRPILQHILDQLPVPAEVYLLTNSRFAADFTDYLKTQDRSVEVFCEDAHCDTDKLGALAAVSAAIKHFNIEQNVVVVAGDNLLPVLEVGNLNPGDDACRLALQTVADRHAARSFGVVEIPEAESAAMQMVQSFEEKPEAPKSNFVSTGFMGVGKNLLPILHDFASHSPDALGAVVTEFLQQKKTVEAFVVPGDWFDVGSYEAYLAAHKALQSKKILVEDSAQLLNTECQGKVYLGAGAQVKNCVLIDTIVYPGTVLEDCHISQSVIDADCYLNRVDLSRKLVRERTTLRPD